MAINFPSNPNNGDTFVAANVTYEYNSTKGIWSLSYLTTQKARVNVGNTAPEVAAEGDLFWDEDIGKLLVYYTDGDSSQWVEASSTGSISAGGGGGASVTVSDTAPAGASEGDLYFDNELLKLFVYYDDGDTQQWIEASPASEANFNEQVQAYLTNTGNIIPSQNSIYSLGNVDFRFKDLYLSGDTLVLGDIAIKAANGSIAVSNVEANGYVVPAETPVGASVSVYDTDSESTGYFALPVGTTEQRPNTAANGYVRFNLTLGVPEWYDTSSNAWLGFYQSPTYEVEYLVIAGGGGGGTVSSVPGGGGGAGGYRSSVVGEPSGGGSSAESKLVVTTGSSYPVVIGLGGAGGPTEDSPGSQGSNSSFGNIVSIGGGGGGGNTVEGTTGGSGGGGMESDGIGRAGTSGQGYAGGPGNEANNHGGGGGGAGEAGSTDGAGLGGDGVESYISGTATYRAGGGGSFGGGLGGGGNGGYPASEPGEANTGGGGGGGGSISPGNKGSSGGSGIVIIRYLGSQKGTGGTVTTASGYTIHTFTSSGTFVA